MVSLILVTHKGIGQLLLGTATDLIGGVCPLETVVISVDHSQDLDTQYKAAKLVLQQHNPKGGALILTDMYGSSPSNLACKLAELYDSVLIAGLNLPMLIRVLNYPDLPLQHLAHKAITGGTDGILLPHPDFG